MSDFIRCLVKHLDNPSKVTTSLEVECHMTYFIPTVIIQTHFMSKLSGFHTACARALQKTINSSNVGEKVMRNTWNWEITPALELPWFVDSGEKKSVKSYYLLTTKEKVIVTIPSYLLLSVNIKHIHML